MGQKVLIEDLHFGVAVEVKSAVRVGVRRRLVFVGCKELSRRILLDHSGHQLHLVSAGGRAAKLVLRARRLSGLLLQKRLGLQISLSFQQFCCSLFHFSICDGLLILPDDFVLCGLSGFNFILALMRKRNFLRY